MEINRNLFWKLIEPEHLKARGFCRKLMGNREDGDDLYQDTLVIAYTKFPTLCDESSFRPWFYRIVVNSFKNKANRAWWKRIVSLNPESEVHTGSENPAPMYIARRRLEKAFKVLSTAEQAKITLFELEGWSISELAALYGKSKGNIKVQLTRIRQKMRKALSKHLSGSKTTQTFKTFEKKDEICVATKPGKN